MKNFNAENMSRLKTGSAFGGKKLLLLLCAILLITGCSLQSPDQGDDGLSQEEKDFNNSGRAKAIIDETDLWSYYENLMAGFTIKYPHSVFFDDKNADALYKLSISAEKIKTLEGTMGFNKETALKNQKSLNNGEYGTEVDWPLEVSKKVVNLGDITAQEFMVLGRFEVCSVSFIRTLYFFNDDNQVVISLSGPEDMIVKTMPEYFTTDPANCGEQKIWDFEKQAQFYNDLADNKGSVIAQEWFDSFSKIIKTINFKKSANDIESSTYYGQLQGKWVSVDDPKSVIEFIKDYKIDYYDKEFMSKAGFKLYDHFPLNKGSVINNDGQYLIVVDGDDKFEYEIIKLSDSELELIYMGRGNILRYEK
jgi:hypothetical protein